MILDKVKNFYNKIAELTNYLSTPIVLIARVYIASVFFKSGLTKIKDWESTLLLFEYEYEVPFIPFELAAWAGTIGELVLPVLLVTGLLTRFSAIGLFFVNIVAVLSLVDIAPAAFNEHLFWGALLIIIILQGGGLLSLDRKLKLT